MIKLFRASAILLALVWTALLIPQIIGFIRGFTYLDLKEDYFIGVGGDNPFFHSVFLFVIFTAAFFLYIIAFRNSLRVSKREIFAWSGFFTLLLIFLFPFTCEDVFYYIASGQLQSKYMMNPYQTTAHQIAGWRADPLLSTTGWGYLLNVYGPLWTYLTKWMVALSEGQLWLAMLIFKSLAGLLHLFNVLLIGLTARSIKINPNQAMLIYGWNPLLLFEFPGHAHNDVLLLTFMILAIFFLSYGRGILAIPALSLAIMIKYTPFLLTPLFAVWYVQRRRMFYLSLGVIVSTILFYLTWHPYWFGLDSFSGVLRQMNFYSLKSLHFLIYQLFMNIFPLVPSALIFKYTASGLNLLFLVVLIFIFRNLFRYGLGGDLEKFLLTGAAILISFLLIANKWYQPWYLSWVLPLVALSKMSNSFALTALLLSYTTEISRIPQIFMGNTSTHVQLSTFMIAWWPLVWYGWKQIILKQF